MRRSTEALLRLLDQAVTDRGGDWSAKLEAGPEYAWSAEVRVTQYPNVRDAPDRSVVFYQEGVGTADDVLEPALRAAFAEVETWSGEPGPRQTGRERA